MGKSSAKIAPKIIFLKCTKILWPATFLFLNLQAKAHKDFPWFPAVLSLLKFCARCSCIAAPCEDFMFLSFYFICFCLIEYFVTWSQGKVNLPN